MKRPAYGLLVGTALVTGLVAVIASIALDERLRDPEGFLGPAWTRIPLMLVGAYLVDVVPRSVWRARRKGHSFLAEARALTKEHWTRERITLVVVGLTAFYVTYVSYRNLKNYLPRIYETMQDPLLHELDRLLFFGNEPAIVLHGIFGETWAAHFFAFIYLLYLPLAPLTVIAWLVWSRNISYGYWYVTANCLTWTLGTISYYMLPTMGPNFWYPWLYRDLDVTGVTDLQDSLWSGRQNVRFNPFSDSIQSVAGFASLHTALTLVIAMLAHYTVRSIVIRWAAWAFFVLTVISTLYFGWHYVADDIGGILIAWLSVYLAGIATGQRFRRFGLVAIPTTSTADVPVDEEPGADHGPMPKEIAQDRARDAVSE